MRVVNLAKSTFQHSDNCGVPCYKGILTRVVLACEDHGEMETFLPNALELQINILDFQILHVFPFLSTT